MTSVGIDSARTCGMCVLPITCIEEIAVNGGCFDIFHKECFEKKKESVDSCPNCNARISYLFNAVIEKPK